MCSTKTFDRPYMHRIFICYLLKHMLIISFRPQVKVQTNTSFNKTNNKLRHEISSIRQESALTSVS